MGYNFQIQCVYSLGLDIIPCLDNNTAIRCYLYSSTRNYYHSSKYNTIRASTRIFFHSTETGVAFDSINSDDCRVLVIITRMKSVCKKNNLEETFLCLFYDVFANLLIDTRRL